MLKLGLIGTVIGFIIMLSSLSDITTFDVTLLQGVLTTMGSGMGVALLHNPISAYYWSSNSHSILQLRKWL